MSYVEVSEEIGKSLYFIHKSGKEISGKQMKYFQTFPEIGEMLKEYEVFEPSCYYVCFVVRGFVDNIHGRYLGRKGFRVLKLYYFDEKKLIKYVEFHNEKLYKEENIECEVVLDTIENQREKYSEMFAYYLMNGYDNIIRNKIEKGFILEDSDIELVKELYFHKEEVIDCREIIFKCDKVKEYSSIYGNTPVTYIYFYGKHLGRTVILKVTEKSLRESFKIWNKGYDINMFVGKTVCIDGNLEIGNGVIKGKRNQVLYFE